MQLDDAQKDAVRKWATEGCGLTEIQKRLDSEFKLSVTFLELRFLVLDLGLKIKESEKAPAGKIDIGGAKTVKTNAAAQETRQDAENAGNGNVSVALDRVVKPGAVISGTVRFSDGVSAYWMLDQLGRLALEADTPGYRPSQEDVQEFQIELRNLLQNRGI